MNLISLFVRAFNELAFRIGLATSGDRPRHRTSKSRTLSRRSNIANTKTGRISPIQRCVADLPEEEYKYLGIFHIASGRAVPCTCAFCFDLSSEHAPASKKHFNGLAALMYVTFNGTASCL